MFADVGDFELVGVGVELVVRATRRKTFVVALGARHAPMVTAAPDSWRVDATTRVRRVRQVLTSASAAVPDRALSWSGGFGW